MQQVMLVLALSACGGLERPNINGNELLANLTGPQIDAFCTWELELTGGRTVTCSDGSGLRMFKNKDDCVNTLPPAPVENCQATVAAAEDCIELLNASPCVPTNGCAPELSHCGGFQPL